MKVPVYSSTIRRKEMDSVLTCLVSEKIGPGEMNQKLSLLLKEVFSIEDSIVFRSQTNALLAALEMLKIEIGSGVIISALAPAWHYRVLKRAGFNPIVVDVNPDTALMTKELIQEALVLGGQVILFPETLGVLPNFDDLLSLNIPIIEDISQSAGSSFNSKPVGTFGVFSLLGLEEKDILTGGGGCVLMASNKREAIVLQKYKESVVTNEILPDINAALAFVQVKEMNKHIVSRQEIFSVFIQSLMQSRHKKFLSSDSVFSSVYSFPVILSSGFKEVKQYANRKEIDLVLAFEDSVVAFLGDDLDSCTQAKSLLMRTVLFPLYPRLGSSNISKIAKLLATLP